MSGRRFALWSAAIVLVAAVLRFWGLSLGLPHLMARPDDEGILLMTGRVAAGHFDLDWAVYPSAWVYLCWAWGVVTLHVGEWLHLLPPAGGYAAVLAATPERLLLLERGMSALAGTLAVVALLALARPVLPAYGALLAGWLLATNFLHVRDCHSLKPDAMLSLAVLGGLAASAALAHGVTQRRAVRAGVALGAATAVKYPGVLLAVPVWLGAVLGSGARGWRRILPPAALVAGAIAAAVFVATSPFLVVNERTRDFLIMVAHIVLPSMFESVQTSAHRPGAFEWLRHGAFAYHFVFSLRHGAGVAVMVLVPLATVWGLAQRRRPLVLLSAVFFAFYYVVMGVSPVRLARYLTPVMPVVALLVAALMSSVVTRLAAERRRGAIFAVVALILTLQPLAASIAHDLLAARTDTRVQATQWLASHVRRGARVAIVGTRIWAWGRPQMPPGVEFVDMQPTLAALDAAHADFLLAHEHVLFSSHVDAEALAVLAPRLDLLAEFDPTCGRSGKALFEEADAYYLPIAGFGAVCRGGPYIRIYAVRPAREGTS